MNDCRKRSKQWNQNQLRTQENPWETTAASPQTAFGTDPVKSIWLQNVCQEKEEKKILEATV